MKTILYISIIFLSLITQAQNYQLNTEATTLKWTGKAAFNAYALSGTLQPKLGKLSVKNEAITELAIVIDMLTLDHENKELKSHLRSKDFFEVKKYQESHFLLSNMPAITSDEVLIKGQMNIKERSQEESLTVRIIKQGNQIRLSFKTKLNRIDYGVTFNSPSLFKKLKQNAIADEFILEGELVFVAN